MSRLPHINGAQPSGKTSIKGTRCLVSLFTCNDTPVLHVAYAFHLLISDAHTLHLFTVSFLSLFRVGLDPVFTSIHSGAATSAQNEMFDHFPLTYDEETAKYLPYDNVAYPKLDVKVSSNSKMHAI